MFMISPEMYGSFLEHYALSVRKSMDQNDQPLNSSNHCISELGTRSAFPFFMDIDLIDRTAWTRSAILEMALEIQSCVLSHYRDAMVDERRRSIVMQCIVARTRAVQVSEKWKTPLHIHFPNVIINQENAIRLNRAICWLLSKKYKHLEHQMSDICDWKVYMCVNLRMLYSNRKMDCPTCCHKPAVNEKKRGRSTAATKEEEDCSKNTIKEIEKLESASDEVDEEAIFRMFSQLEQSESLSRTIARRDYAHSSVGSCVQCGGKGFMIEPRAYVPYVALNGMGAEDAIEFSRLSNDMVYALEKTCIRTLDRTPSESQGEQEIQWSSKCTPGFNFVSTHNSNSKGTNGNVNAFGLDLDEIIQKVRDMAINQASSSRSTITLRTNGQWVSRIDEPRLVPSKQMVELPLSDTRCAAIANYVRTCITPGTSVSAGLSVSRFYSEVTLASVTVTFKAQTSNTLKKALAVDTMDDARQLELVREYCEGVQNIASYLVRVRGRNVNWCDNLGKGHTTSSVWWCISFKNCQTRCSCRKNNEMESISNPPVCCSAYRGKTTTLPEDLKKKLFGLRNSYGAPIAVSHAQSAPPQSNSQNTKRRAAPRQQHQQQQHQQHQAPRSTSEFLFQKSRLYNEKK